MLEILNLLELILICLRRFLLNLVVRLFVLFIYPFVDVCYEALDPFQVVFGITLNIIVARPLHEIWLEALVLHFLPQSLAVADVHDLVTLPMDYVDGAIEVLYTINVGKLVEAECPTET